MKAFWIAFWVLSCALEALLCARLHSLSFAPFSLASAAMVGLNARQLWRRIAVRP